MQYSASHVATTALVLSQNGLRSNLRASSFYKFPGRVCAQTPLVLHAWMLMHAYMHLLNPLLKILASQSGNDASYSQPRLRPFTLIILVMPLEYLQKLVKTCIIVNGLECSVVTVIAATF